MIADTQINTTTQNIQYDPSITSLINGGFVVSWVSYFQDGHLGGIYAQIFNANGVTQGNEFRVNTFTSGEQLAPAITALTDGGFVVCYQSFRDGIVEEIYAKLFNASGAAQEIEFHVNTYTIGYQMEPEITALNDGGFVVIWESYDQDGSGMEVYAQRFNANGVAQDDEFRVNTYKIGYQGEPAITTLNNGGFVVCWVSDMQGGSSYEIYVQRFNANGEALGSEFRVNTYKIGGQYSPAITALNDGGFVVSWMSDMQDGSGYGIYAQRFNAYGVAQGNEFRVNTYAIDDQRTPAITTLTDGGFVVCWESHNQDGSGGGIYAQRFNASGEAQGSEFRANTYTDSSQYSPAITALNDGGFVITWTSADQDGDEGFSIFAHRYNATGNEVGWTASDRLFNWAENIYPDLFPNHPESIEIYGYHARIYENGNALGEQNDSIYFYDGNSIILVGTVNDYFPDAIAAGF